MHFQIIGTIIIVFFAILISLIIEYWIYLLGVGVGFAVLYGVVVLLTPLFERYHAYQQARIDALKPLPGILGEVKIDGGYAVVTREPVSKFNRYPCVLTLSHFNHDGCLTSSHATYLKNGYDEGNVLAGVLKQQPVFVHTGSGIEKRIIEMMQPDGTTVWRVYPPNDASPLVLDTCHPGRN